MMVLFMMMMKMMKDHLPIAVEDLPLAITFTGGRTETCALTNLKIIMMMVASLAKDIKQGDLLSC